MHVRRQEIARERKLLSWIRHGRETMSMSKTRIAADFRGGAHVFGRFSRSIYQP